MFVDRVGLRVIFKVGIVSFRYFFFESYFFSYLFEVRKGLFKVGVRVDGVVVFMVSFWVLFCGLELSFMLGIFVWR